MFKFEHFPKRVGNPIPWSKRRESLAKSKPRRQAKKIAKKLPLFEEQLFSEAEEVEVDIEEVKDKRQQRENDWIKRQRQEEARRWKEARKRFFELNEVQKAEVLRQYNDNKWIPKRAGRLWSIVDKVSGDQIRRVIRCEAEFKMYQLKQKAKEEQSGIQVELI